MRRGIFRRMETRSTNEEPPKKEETASETAKSLPKDDEDIKLFHFFKSMAESEEVPAYKRDYYRSQLRRGSFREGRYIGTFKFPDSPPRRYNNTESKEEK